VYFSILTDDLKVKIIRIIWAVIDWSGEVELFDV